MITLMVDEKRIGRNEITAAAAKVVQVISKRGKNCLINWLGHQEADQDDTKSLSRTEFKRVLQRIPDFQS